ncbi:MAG: ATP-binding protein [Bacilli bacterium]|nr:ATP-binding protein [Bacilli bacterium]
MKLIQRTFYLEKLINTMNTPDIKVITGVRRAGKSKLLEEFKNYVINNEKDYNIIHINYNLTKFENLKEYHKLIEYVENNYISNKHNFLLIDEVQMCIDFEKAINNFHAEEKFDIYITGSNAFLMSSDLATLFTGRTFEIKVYPFSYKEFLNYYNIENSDKAFDNYVLEGGLSGAYLYKENEEKYNYVNDIYNTLIKRDICNKYKIKKDHLLDMINDFLMDNISNLTSIRNIADSLTNNKDKINHKTVSSYINYLCNAFLFYKIRRYDIQGKKYLSSQDKYYLVDHSFKYAKLGTKNINYGRVYENIVAIELLRRGYEVYVGTLYEKEIDFVATKRNEKIYIQVSSDIGDDFDNDTFRREVDPLLKIKDAYPKMVIARTKHDDYQYEGIQIVDIANWLAKEN